MDNNDNVDAPEVQAETPDLFAPSSETKRLAVTLNVDQLTAIGMPEEEAKAFLHLRNKYLQKPKMDWSRIVPPEDTFIQHYETLENISFEQTREVLNKVVALALNGGLGLRLGCKGPKSLLQILKKDGHHDSLTFLDCKVTQIEELNKQYGVDIPLVLMNSFNTDQQTAQILDRYRGRVTIKTFMQSKFPIVYRDSTAPVPTNYSQDEYWYPPGSGDAFECIYRCGLLEELKKMGKEILFITNVENLGASIDSKIGAHFLNEKLDYLLEVTHRISTDEGGGILVKEKDGKVHVIETSEIPFSLHKKFIISQYKYWNSNNIWVSINQTLNLLEKGALDLDFIVKQRNLTGRGAIQLETPAGMALHCFQNTAAMKVPRIRYTPVKTTSQLLQAQSDIYVFDRGTLKMNPIRVPPTEPLVRLGQEFRTRNFLFLLKKCQENIVLIEKQLEEYEKRFASVPNLIEIEQLTISGDVYMGRDVTLKGTVIIVADTGTKVNIPDGTTLENKIVAGSLMMTDY